MPVSDVGSVYFCLKPSAPLFLLFYSDGGQIQSISFYSGSVRRGGYPGTSIGSYSSTSWYDCEFVFDMTDDSWIFKMNGNTLTSRTDGGGSGAFTKFYIGSFYSPSSVYGHIYLDDVMYDFEYDYPYYFEDDSIDSFPSGDDWYRYANAADGTVTVQNQDGHGHILDLYKSGGTYCIYARNYPQLKMICTDRGYVKFMLKPSAPLFLDFYSDVGVIQSISFYGGSVKRDGYPGTSIGSYSSSTWYFCEFYFNQNSGTWRFTMNGVELEYRYDNGGSGDFASFRIRSFYSGGVNGHIYIDNIDYLFS